MTEPNVLQMLNLPPGSSLPTVASAYAAARAALLQNDPNVRRPQVTTLDEAFSRHRDASFGAGHTAKHGLGGSSVAQGTTSAPRPGTSSPENDFPANLGNAEDRDEDDRENENENENENEDEDDGEDDDEDDDDPSEDIVRTLAGYSWSSTGAGAGWSGRGVLGTTSAGRTFSVVREDWNDETDEIDLPEEGELLWQAVAIWIQQHDTVASAALALEPLDPSGTLAAADRQGWQDLLSKIELFFNTDLAGRDNLGLRHTLAAQSETYDMIRRALAEPAGQLGLSLRATLQNSLLDGSTGGLESGHWDDPDPDPDPDAD